MGATAGLKAQILDKIFRNQDFTITPRISAHTGDPGTDGANEVVGGTYSRQTPNFNATGVDGTIETGANLVFPGMPACTVTHIGVWDNGSGEFKWGVALTSPVVVAAGNTFQMDAGQLAYQVQDL